MSSHSHAAKTTFPTARGEGETATPKDSTLDGVNRWVERTLEVFTVGLLLSLTTIVLLAVVLRTFGGSLPWYDEVASINLAWLSFYGACLAALKRSHMGFPGLITKAPIALRSTLFIVSELIVIGFFGVVGWFGYQVLEVLAWDSLIALPNIGLNITQSVVPISAALFILCELLSLPHAWRKMCAGVNSEEEEIAEAIRLAEEDLKEHRS
ncbi:MULTISPECIES: TRAP transporter small permease [unclassified Cobetia]|uniref:TRAP transporter small permease n=1 Tax=unclassified Cobetia TaxID=2609414 RepID=UPI0020979D16|nr:MULTISPECIES: TRAP transporter small permease [unclassified Cobetia]MCO7230892.1 TRAP transporter small permease [Cobetia sp. Dlab-2-AX]MCO7234701.1 TRAP transporter small permease [Cobetia sp. Dlab-2-U]